MSEILSAVKAVDGLFAGGIGTITGIVLGSAGFWQWIKRKEDKPLDRAKEADSVVATSVAVVEMQNTLLKQLKEELSEQANRLEQESEERIRNHRREFEKDIERMRNKVDNLERANGNLRLEINDFKRRNEHLELVNQQLTERNQQLMVRLDIMNDMNSSKH